MALAEAAGRNAKPDADRKAAFGGKIMSRGLPVCRVPISFPRRTPATFALCTHSRSKFVPPPDYVTGKPVKPRQLSCYEARNFDDCGPQGRFLGSSMSV
jgi:hypothetical protein